MHTEGLCYVLASIHLNVNLLMTHVPILYIKHLLRSFLDTSQSLNIGNKEYKIIGRSIQ